MKIIMIGAIWCPACLIMKNRWIKIEKKYPNFSKEEYDYDKHEEFCKALDVGTKLPVAIILDGNKEIGRIVGEKTEKELFKIMEEYGVEK